MPILKVFRTTLGFHDAYIAAPSKAAALRAWGAGTDLFAMGAAEAITDPVLTAAPLAQPGTIIKLSRGTVADYLAAEADRSANNEPSTVSIRKRPKPKPLPSRAKVEAADAVLARAQASCERALAKLDAQAAKLSEHRAKIQADHKATVTALQGKRDAADEAYQKAINDWRE